MNERHGDTANLIARGFVAGAIAGAVASFAMDRFQAVTASLLPSNGTGEEPATEKAADAVARRTVGYDVPTAVKPLAGQAVHYAFGIGLGIAYGIAAEFRPSVTVGFGTAFGMGTAALLDDGVVLAVGLGAAPRKSDLSSNIYSYASHLVFGGVSEMVRRQVAGTLIKKIRNKP